ncbi:MAG: isoprenyl transferase [Thermoflexales bacterium]
MTLTAVSVPRTLRGATAVVDAPVASHGIRHLAIIMDGNGRWAKARNLPRLAGHKAGTDNLHRILRACKDQGIRIVTLYAFSTENWNRPRDEVEGLMKLLETSLERELESLHREGVQIRHLGQCDRIPPRLVEKIQAAIERTKNNTALILNVALNYGGRAEIVDAVRRIIADGIQPAEVSEALISRYLYTADLPDPDLIIRTSGEYRVSNFLIWQGAYAEYYVTEVCWPDFDERELRRAIEQFTRRERRFGGLK